MSDTIQPTEKQEPIVEAVARWLNTGGANVPEYRGHAMDLIEALEKAGYVIVPRKPTEAMLGGRTDPRGGHFEATGVQMRRTIWRAMIDNFSRGPARYKDGSLVEPFPAKARLSNIPVPR